MNLHCLLSWIRRVHYRNESAWISKQHLKRCLLLNERTLGTWFARRWELFFLFFRVFDTWLLFIRPGMHDKMVLISVLFWAEAFNLGNADIEPCGIYMILLVMCLHTDTLLIAFSHWTHALAMTYIPSHASTLGTHSLSFTEHVCSFLPSALTTFLGYHTLPIWK